MNRDRNNEISRAIHKFTKYWIENRIPIQIRKLLRFSKGVALGKEKEGIPDYDVRPVVMLDSIMRIVDRLSVNNIPKKKRKELMGPYQVIGEKAACEIATIALDHALQIQKEDENLVVLGIDAVNAYNSYDRQNQYQLLVEDLEDMVFYYENMIKMRLKWILIEIHESR